ncbi:WecB/TagA/CpsF family glycosyltransferase [Edaphobacter dinghuensis]|uniref:UDP-N-acetyl-D-mannosaminuronic acid transferase n=1 Tax=Edaphobacter dinghuensis TaxID=1560005 RepID=A0A917HQH9_9BACT|nr:WecB/TagA/CpsF family glycosyltransferase [Edaphobacter dinghuensis]GGG86040.1 UDP-N-acetyl-D-mannosaminuronic acid transferase [Edaphobacter dinghuensis]
MLNLGKKNVLGILIDAVDYEAVISFVFECARQKRGAMISALAVHGVMTGVLDPEHKFRLNRFDLLVPDGQPVRWVMNWLYGTKLLDRVYGPELMRKICERATSEGTSIYLYGSTKLVVTSLAESLARMFPEINIVGSEPSAFRKLNPDEKASLQQRIQSSGASIIFVGLGCPRQEIFTYELGGTLSAPVLAVGAAFPLLAGILPQAPPWMQRFGLEWLFRLLAEPRRLWRRYLYLNPAYLILVALQGFGVRRFSSQGSPPVNDVLVG